MTFAAASAIKVKVVDPILILRKTGELVRFLKGSDNIPQEYLLHDTDSMEPVPDIACHVSERSSIVRGGDDGACSEESAVKNDNNSLKDSDEILSLSNPIKNNSIRNERV